MAVGVNRLKRPEWRSETLRLVPLDRFVVSCIPTWFWGPMVTLEDCLAAFFAADELKGFKKTTTATTHYSTAVLKHFEEVDCSLFL